MHVFRLYDVYDELINGERIKIGEYNTLEQVAKACNEYAKECDNECEFALYEFKDYNNKYKLVRNWTYTNCTVIIK